MKSLQGQLLAASPYLVDPNFVRTVVLMVQHGPQGALGVVLNRPIDKTVQDLWREVDEPPCDSQKRLNLGGPVSGPLMALHTQAPLGEIEVLPGLFFSADKTHLEELVQSEDDRYKLFIGHSGWGSGQLESELNQGAWLILPATIDYVFDDGEKLWRTVTREVGRSTLASVLHIKHVPDDPTVN